MTEPATLHCPICHTHYADSGYRRCPNDGSPLLDAEGREVGWIGEIVQDRYRVLRFLGKGGMAQVYEAEHIASGRRVAIKIVQPRLAVDPAAALERFRREALLLSRITHPNVVAIEDFGTLREGALFMVMELLQGRSLQQELEEGELPAAEALDVVMQVCEAVQAAHDAGVAHRDIKPANVFLETRRASGARVVKVLDFGISKIVDEKTTTNLTKAGSVFGTPEYMSPQQARGEKADLSSDIYALGVMLYRMLLGAVPFTGESYMEVLIKHITEAPPWPSDVATKRRLPASTRDVVFTALEKTPEKRYPSVADFARAIQALRDGMATSYSVVGESVDTVRVPGVSRPPPASAAPLSTRTIPLASAKGLDSEVVSLAPDVYWVGRRTGGALECNTYLRVYRSEEERIAVVIDPGPPRDLQTIGQKVASVLGSITEVDLLFVNHQDPDVSFNTVTFQQLNPRAHVICSEHTWRLIHLMGLEPQHYSAVDQFRDATMRLVTGHEVRFVPTPFCHFRGAVMYYDVSSRVLFSGDLFGGLTRSKQLLSRGDVWDGIDVFHQIYMPSGRAVQLAIEQIRKLDPPPRLIAPQHGAIFAEDQIDALLDHLEHLPMGMDLESVDEDASRFLGALNMLVRYLVGVMGQAPVRSRLRRLEGDSTFPGILVLGEDASIRELRVGARLAASAVVRDLTEIVPSIRLDEWLTTIEHAKRAHGIFLPPVR
jgi:serine/threonine-protein kinase